jgi:phospholipase/carboxylesterase
MTDMIESELQTFKNWTFRFRPAQAEPHKLLVILHGWTGDERSMWPFTQKLSPNYAILAPRAPSAAPEGGYSWREIRPGSWGMATLEDFRSSAEALLAMITAWSAENGFDDGWFDVMGFSQGAAMTYTLGLLYPERVRRLVVLAGFIPEGGEALVTLERLADKPVFVTHGRQDDMLPVELARWAAGLLEAAGVRLTYCESDAAHKVSRQCIKEMEVFMEEDSHAFA